MKATILKYLESGIITFLSTFALTVAPLIGGFSFADGTWRATLVSLAAVAGRTALKAVWEGMGKPLCQFLIATYAKQTDLPTQG